MVSSIFAQSPQKALNSVCKTKLRHYLPEEAIKEVVRAFHYADSAHRGQVRRTGEEYIHHPIAVTSTLADLQMESKTLVAALLHDVIEDTNASKEDVHQKFGEDVAQLVDGVSKISQISFETKEHAEAENFRKMLMAMSEDVRVMIIKLADRLHNMQTLSALRSDKRKRISRQTIEIYAPIAERLGLYHWARDLQDLAFAQLYPMRHKAIGKALSEREGNRKRIIEKLRKEIKETLSDAGLNDFEVKGRRKTVFSIYKKMRTKMRSFKEIHDIYGFRVIVNENDDCYRALGYIHASYNPIPGRFQDYIAIPKANGYQSLHTVVFGPLGDNIEVQIRTQQMDHVAEAGVAAHWIYKTGMQEVRSSSNLTRQWLLDLLDPAHHSGNPVEFLDHLKTDLYPDEVYVFTPKGDIKKLPRGSTALDFAYAVHTDIGTHCSGARINRALASLPTVLQNGDRVEIITARDNWPNATWLNYTVTAKARANIRSYLKQQTREQALDLGKRLLAGVTKKRLFSRRIAKNVKAKLLVKLGLEDWDALLVDIGLGERLPRIVARQIAAIETNNGDANANLEPEPLRIKGSEGLLVTYAKCCGPIPGDPILATFTAGHGLVVHTADCPNINELRKNPEQFLMVAWDENIDGLFLVRLHLRLKHKAGAFAAVATAIAENESNIHHVDLHEGSGNFRHIDFVLEVKNRVHLAAVIKSIRQLLQVEKVSRLKG